VGRKGVPVYAEYFAWVFVLANDLTGAAEHHAGRSSSSSSREIDMHTRTYAYRHKKYPKSRIQNEWEERNCGYCYCYCCCCCYCYCYGCCSSHCYRYCYCYYYSPDSSAGATCDQVPIQWVPGHSKHWFVAELQLLWHRERKSVCVRVCVRER